MMKRHLFYTCSIVLVVVSLGGHLLAQQTSFPSPDEKPKYLKWQERFFKGLTNELEPDGVGRVTELARYARRFPDAIKLDRTLFYWDVQTTGVNGRVMASGSVNFVELKQSYLGALERLGFRNIDDQIEVLPSKNLGNKLFGLVTTPAELTYAKPDPKSGLMTQCLFGDPIYLLHYDPAGYYLCHSPIGYLGYIRADAVRLMTKAEFQDFLRAPKVVFLKDCRYGRTNIPFGAKLRVAREQPKQATKQLRVMLPYDRTITVPMEMVSRSSLGGKNFRNRMLEIAQNFRDTPYVFGAKSTAGADCSGFVWSTFRALGLSLPRDAKQQVLVGELAGTRWFREEIQPGDLLYFIGFSGSVMHTGIYKGNQEFIHLSPPRYQVSSFDPKAANYTEFWTNAFCFAKRPVVE